MVRPVVPLTIQLPDENYRWEVTGVEADHQPVHTNSCAPAGHQLPVPAHPAPVTDGTLQFPVREPFAPELTLNAHFLIWLFVHRTSVTVPRIVSLLHDIGFTQAVTAGQVSQSLDARVGAFLFGQGYKIASYPLDVLGDYIAAWLIRNTDQSPDFIVIFLQQMGYRVEGVEGPRGLRVALGRRSIDIPGRPWDKYASWLHHSQVTTPMGLARLRECGYLSFPFSVRDWAALYFIQGWVEQARWLERLRYERQREPFRYFAEVNFTKAEMVQALREEAEWLRR